MRGTSWWTSLLLVVGAAACGDDDVADAEQGAAEQETSEEGPVEESAGVPPPSGEQEAAEASGPALEDPADPNEACAMAIVVAWQGAEYASEDITRTRDEARARAEELLGELTVGADFAALAREHSDAGSSAPRGGMLGTYTREAWPGPHEPIADAVFDLRVHETSEILEAPYGWTIARRCPVEKVHTRHILVRYRGAEGAGEDVTRTEEEARELASEIHDEVTAEGADFEAIARERSEDTSAERGGDMGEVGRGLFAEEYENVAFALDPGAISPPAETEYGFHVIQRVE